MHRWKPDITTAAKASSPRGHGPAGERRANQRQHRWGAGRRLQAAPRRQKPLGAGDLPPGPQQVLDAAERVIGLALGCALRPQVPQVLPGVDIHLLPIGRQRHVGGNDIVYTLACSNLP